MIKSKYILAVIIIMLSYLSSNNALAVGCLQYNNTIGIMGLDNKTGLIYAHVTSSSNECSCADFRFSSVNSDTNKALSILLAAKMSNKLVRVDLVDSTNCDSAGTLYIQ